ncbi:MAG: PqqD family peptide modification chaperone [Balneolales bacterium]
MNLETYIVRSGSTLTTPLNDELVMFDSATGKFYGFNQVATVIWDLLEAGMTVKDLCIKLTDDFDISEKQCHEEVLAFLPKLVKNRLITIQD